MLSKKGKERKTTSATSPEISNFGSSIFRSLISNLLLCWEGEGEGEGEGHANPGNDAQGGLVGPLLWFTVWGRPNYLLLR